MPYFIAQCCIPPLQSEMCSSEFLRFTTARLWAQDIPCLCYHPCPARVSHLPPSCLLYITDALTSPLCINFFLLLAGTLEVTACSSRTDGIGFTSVVVRTILPLALPHALPSLQSGRAWSGLIPHAGRPTCAWQERTEGRSVSPWKVLGYKSASYTHSNQTKANGGYFLF